MTKEKAKQIGRKLALKSGFIGLTIAYGIFGTLMYSWGSPILEALFWIANVEFAFHLLVGAVGLLLMASFFGRFAGTEILIKNRNPFWIGIKYGLLILITGTLIGSCVGFFQEGLDNIGTSDNPFFDYFFKPLYWVTLFGLLPVIIVGLWFGGQIKLAGYKDREV